MSHGKDHPTIPFIKLNMALLLHRNDREFAISLVTEAINQFEGVERARETSIRFYSLAANLALHILNTFEDAKKCYKKALSYLDPKTELEEILCLHHMIALSHCSLKDYKTAISEIEEVIKKAKGSPYEKLILYDSYSFLSSFYRLTKAFNKSLEMGQKAIEISKGDEVDYWQWAATANYCHVLLQMGEDQRGGRCMQAADKLKAQYKRKFLDKVTDQILGIEMPIIFPTFVYLK